MRRKLSHWLLIFLVGAGLAGCSAEPGELSALFIHDNTIASLTLTDLSVPVSGSLPSSQLFHLNKESGSVVWTTTGGQTYSYFAELERDEGKDGSPGFLGIGSRDPVDGKDIVYLFRFSGANVTIQRAMEWHTGIAY